MDRTSFALAAAFTIAAAFAGAQTAQTAQPRTPARALTVTTPRAAAVYGRQTPFAVTAAEAWDTTRVSPDVDNMPVADAVRKVLEAAGKELEIDKDIPDTRVSLKAKDIRLNTFLDLMSQAAGAGWSVEMRDGKARYRFGKNLRRFGNLYFDYTSPKTMRALEVPKAGALFNGFNKGDSFVFTDPDSGLSSYRSYLGSEVRTSFTCPHCKGKVTAIQTRTAPRCPKCSRVFQSGWDYCPADGTKRPADSATEWKHCPLCGKEVDFSKAEKRSSRVEAVEPTGEAAAVIR